MIIEDFIDSKLGKIPAIRRYNIIVGRKITRQNNETFIKYERRELNISDTKHFTERVIERFGYNLEATKKVIDEIIQKGAKKLIEREQKQLDKEADARKKGLPYERKQIDGHYLIDSKSTDIVVAIAWGRNEHSMTAYTAVIKTVYPNERKQDNGKPYTKEGEESLTVESYQIKFGISKKNILFV
jgi:hypothetical protein